jgi:hypothetical protein
MESYPRAKRDFSQRRAVSPGRQGAREKIRKGNISTGRGIRVTADTVTTAGGCLSRVG